MKIKVHSYESMGTFDGPGLRYVVFLQGCPFRCLYCANPDTIDAVGESKPTEPEYILEQAISMKPFFGKRGGITFSGGEPTGQPEFLLEVLDRTAAMHRAIETSAYCSSKVFSAVLERVDYVMMDLKLMDPERHRHYTGVPNEPILENLERLKKSGKPFRIRIPVIPGVNDSDENFEQTALRLTDAPALEQVELLPYHVTAGAKYAMVGRQYRPEFDTAAAPNLNTGIFLAHGIACTHL